MNDRTEMGPPTGRRCENVEVVYSPPREHVCRPGWTERVSDGTGDMALPAGTVTLHQLDLPAGTVWECPCGRCYVAIAYKPFESPGLLMCRVHWRPEKRRERRRRLSGSGRRPNDD